MILSMSFCLYNKKNITRQLEDRNFIFSGSGGMFPREIFYNWKWNFLRSLELTKNEIFDLAFITIGFQLLVFQLIPKPIPFEKSVRRVSVDRCFTDRNFNVPSTVVALTHQKNQFTVAESVKILVMFLGCSQPLDLLMKAIFRGSNLSLINKWEKETIFPL